MTRRSPNPWLLALWFALACGLLEGTLYQLPAVRMFIIRQNVRLDADAWWLPVAANLVWFGVLAAIVWLLARWHPQRFGWKTQFGIFAFMGALSLILIQTRIHDSAAYLLSIGVGVALARFAGPREAGVRKAMAWSLPVLAVVALGLAIGQPLLRKRVESAFLAKQGARGDRPNVVLIILDTVRDFSLSVSGYDRKTTPHLEEWAQKGVLFERAMATAPWTLPSHATMFTGRYPYELTAGFRAPLDGTHPVIAEVMADHGWVTGGFVANYGYVGRQLGLGRGFLHFEDTPDTWSRLVFHSGFGRWLKYRIIMPGREKLLDNHDNFGRKLAPTVTDDFLRWTGSLGDRPYFAFLNYYDAHFPYLPAEPYDRRFTPADQPPYKPRESENIKAAPSPDEAAQALNAYDGAIAWLDAELDRLLKGLEAQGQLENTVVVISSDHGEHFGEHELFGHGNSLYRQLLQVPLIVISPKLPQGMRVQQVVSLRDLPRTLMDLAGIRDEDRIPGTSLRPTWESWGTPAPISPVYAELRRPGKTWQAILAEGNHLIRSQKDAKGNTTQPAEVELYDMDADPLSLSDLIAAGDTSRAAVAARLAGRVDSMLQGFKPPKVEGAD